MKGRELVAKRYLVIVLPFDLLTNQLAESGHICEILIGLRSNFDFGPRFVDLLDLWD